MRDLMDRARTELADDLVSLNIGLDAEEALLQADVILGMTLGMVESLLDRRTSNRPGCIEVLTHASIASLGARPSSAFAPAAE
jgi:hypothetical protein